MSQRDGLSFIRNRLERQGVNFTDIDIVTRKDKSGSTTAIEYTVLVEAIPQPVTVTIKLDFGDDKNA